VLNRETMVLRLKAGARIYTVLSSTSSALLSTVLTGLITSGRLIGMIADLVLLFFIEFTSPLRE
jgi:hypothetical protein